MSNLERLITKIRQGKVILWAGAGFSRYAGIPTGPELVDLLVKVAESSERKALRSMAHTLPDAVELFADMRHGSVADLLHILEKAINITPKNMEYHRLLTEIVQIRTIVTTNYDKLFESAYGNDIVTLVQDEHVPTHALDDRVKLYKIHGDFSSPTKMILRKSDYERFDSNHVDDSPLWSQIKSMLSTSSVLFVGYSMDDSNFSSVLKQVQKYLGAYQHEHFFVAPDIPEYQINKLSNQGIAAISMTAEELIPEIHSEVKRHILEDVQRGWIQPSLAQGFSRKLGLNVTYELPPEGVPIIRGFGPTCSDESLRLTITVPSDISFDRLTTGETREITLPDGSILTMKADFNGISIPLMDNSQDGTFHIKRIPDNSYPGKLILSDSNLVLSSVRVEVYRDLEQSTVEIQHKHFRLVLTLNPETGSNNMSLNFLNCSDAYDGKLVTQFVSTWFDGDTLRLVNESNGDVSSLGGIPAQSIENSTIFIHRVRAIQRFYEEIILIQRYFNAYFDIPEKPSEDEQAVFEQLLSMATGNVEHCASITLNMKDGDGVHNLLNLEGKSLRFTSNMSSVRLFGKEIQLGVMCVDITDVVIANRDLVLAKLTSGVDEIAVVVGSQSGDITVRYERQPL